MKNLILTLLMIAGFILSGQDKNPKNWMIGAIVPLPNSSKVFSETSSTSSSTFSESYHHTAYPLGATIGYKGFTFGFYATRVAVTRRTIRSSRLDYEKNITRLPEEDYWNRSYSLGYQYTFGKSSDLLLKPIIGAHGIVNETNGFFDFAFDFGVRYKSFALLASIYNETYALDYQKYTFPMINVGNRKTYWSIKAQYYL